MARLFLLAALLFFYGTSFSQSCNYFCENHRLLLSDEHFQALSLAPCDCRVTGINYLDTLFDHSYESKDYVRQKEYLSKQRQLVEYEKLQLPLVVKLNYYFNEALYLKNLNKYREADEILDLIIAEIDLADPDLQDLKFAELFSLSYQQKASNASARSQYALANQHLEYSINRELERSQKSGQRPVLHSMQSRIGSNYAAQGHLNIAYTYYREGNEPMKQAARMMSPEVLDRYAYIFIGYFISELNAAMDLNDLEGAESLLELILKIYKTDHARNLPIFLAQSSLYMKKREFEKAEEFLVKARALAFDTLSSFEDRLSFYIENTAFLIERGKQEQALRTLDSALVISKELVETGSQWSHNMLAAHTEKIKLLKDMNRPEESLKYVASFIEEVIDKLSQNLIFEDHLSFINDLYPIFELGLEMCSVSSTDCDELSFQILECTKALSLLKESQFARRKRTTVQDSLILEYKTLSYKMSQNLLNQANGDSSINNANRLYEARIRLDHLKNELGSQSQKQGQLTLDQYQKSLPTSDLHVLTFSGDSNYYFLSITKDSAFLQQMDKKGLDITVSLFGESIQKAGDYSYQSHAQSLGEKMRNLFVGGRHKDHLIFSSDGLLATIPIEAIMLDDQFLINNYNVSYSPSAKLQFALNEKKPQSNPRACVFSPSFQEEVPLDYAMEESKVIREIMNSTLFENQEATKDKFIETSEEFNIVHLATHAKAIYDQPSKSYINFTNSKLYFDEIRSLLLDAELVYLSACETNRGQSFDGEGVQSLSRNFLACGASSVVSSLWAISDQTTSAITISFYQYLKEGFSKSEALSQAKLDFMERYGNEGSHPYYWAGLVLTGSNEPLYPKTKVKFWVLSGLSSLIILLICYVFLHPRRSLKLNVSRR